VNRIVKISKNTRQRLNSRLVVLFRKIFVRVWNRETYIMSQRVQLNVETLNIVLYIQISHVSFQPTL
jgi:hypothetical protein